jgi:cytochrome c oxidase subunit 2
VALANGSQVTADARYIRDSILLPVSQVTAGYTPIMPSFKGQVSEEDILKLVAYIRSLAATESQP